jgi:HK97 family phage major capsid protein/HK97 family phage prohead protease
LGGFTERILPEAVSLDLLNNSDIKVYLEHDKQRGILARSKQGNGSLKYSIDDLGVMYEFEAPNTQLGNEVLEGLNRGDYDESSFAFTVKRDSWETKGGKYYRTIHEIERMYDFSIVADGAYSETYVSVAKRSLNDYIAGIDMEVRNKEEDKPEDKEKQEEESAEATTEAPEEEGTDPVEDNEDREPSSDSLKEEEKEEDKDKRNNLNKETMEFSLIKTINDVVNRRSFNESAAAVIEQGQAEMRKAGLTYNGDIILPTEYRADVKAGNAPGAIGTNVQNIISPIYNTMVFSKAGATYLSGLNGDVKVPVLNGSTVAWADEVGAAQDAAASIESVTLTPKRLTAFVDISKQFLLQETASAEEMLKQDLVKAVAQKLEATILGSAAKSTTQPAGLFNGVTTDTAAVTWANICDMEGALEGKEVGNKCWIVSPTAKSTLKQTEKSTGTGKYILEGNEVEGYPVYCSAAASGKGVLFGDFSDLVIAQWGAVEVTVDPYSQAGNGKVRLVVNAYFDAQLRRTSTIQKKLLK